MTTTIDRDASAIGGLLVEPVQTQGQLAIVQHVVPPHGLGAPLHTHSATTEVHICVAGRIGARVGGTDRVLDVGELSVAPIGIPHTFWNPTDEPARILEVITPPGFEKYFDDLRKGFGPDGFDFEVVGAAMAAHDIEADMASIPALLGEHGLVL